MTLEQFSPTTGRLSTSQPEMQHFPGTPQAVALSRKLAKGRELGKGKPLLDLNFPELELRATRGYFDQPSADTPAFDDR